MQTRTSITNFCNSAVVNKTICYKKLKNHIGRIIMEPQLKSKPHGTKLL